MKKNIKLIVLITIFSLMFPYYAFAGSINENEQRVLSVARGTFEYNGEEYVASSAYVALLNAKLLADDVDLTSQQADAAIQQIYANVATAVQQGYLVSVSGKETATKQEESQNSKNSNEKETEKNRSNKNQTQENEKKTGKNQDEKNDSDNEVNVDDLTKVNENNNEEKDSKETTNVEITQHEDLDDEDITLKNPADSSRKNKKGDSTDKDRNIKWIAGSIVVALLIVAGIIFLIIRKLKNRAFVKTNKSMRYDIHSHILPGVDDGAKNMEMSLQMIEEAYNQGIRYMIATPHYTPGEKNPSPERLEKVYKELCEQVKKKGLDIKIGLGNEVLYSPSVIGDLENHKIQLMPEEFTKLKGNVVLVEFSPKDDYRTIYEAVKTIVSNMYTPIIAHVERYENIDSNEKYKELKEAGAKFQINVRTLKKAGNKQFVKRAHRLIREGMVDYLGTDAHNLTTRAVDTKEMVGYIEKYSNDEDKRKLLDNEKNRHMPRNGES